MATKMASTLTKGDLSRGKNKGKFNLDDLNRCITLGKKILDSIKSNLIGCIHIGSGR